MAKPFDVSRFRKDITKTSTGYQFDSTVLQIGSAQATLTGNACKVFFEIKKL